MPTLKKRKISDRQFNFIPQGLKEEQTKPKVAEKQTKIRAEKQ